MLLDYYMQPLFGAMKIDSAFPSLYITVQTIFTNCMQNVCINYMIFSSALERAQLI